MTIAWQARLVRQCPTLSMAFHKPIPGLSISPGHDRAALLLLVTTLQASFLQQLEIVQGPGVEILEASTLESLNIVTTGNAAKVQGGFYGCF